MEILLEIKTKIILNELKIEITDLIFIESILTVN